MNNNWIIVWKDPFAAWNIKSKGFHKESVEDNFVYLLKNILQLGEYSNLLYSIDGHEKALNRVCREMDFASRSRFQDFGEFLGCQLFSNINLFNSKGRIIELNFCKNKLNEIDKANIYNYKNSKDHTLYFINLSVSIRNNSFFISIYLFSDIFFPFVACPEKYKKKYDDKDEIGPMPYFLRKHGYDNRVLSNLNGSRFNFFLSELKKIVDNSDKLLWEGPDLEHWRSYHSMIHADKIDIS